MREMLLLAISLIHWVWMNNSVCTHIHPPRGDWKQMQCNRWIPGPHQFIIDFDVWVNLVSSCGRSLLPFLFLEDKCYPYCKKFVSLWEMLACTQKYFESGYANYKSCEQTESYYRSKLTRKLWKLAADKHHKHRCNVWLIIMGVKTKYQWVNSWKTSPNFFSCKISSSM